MRIGLVGFGYWARVSYLPLVDEITDAKVVSIAARTEGSRTAAREQLGEEVKLFAGYSELIEAGDVDAVLIALTSELNAAAAAEALRAGLHTFVEPPFARDEDTERMLSLAESGSAVLHVDVEPRYLPAVQALRRLFGEEAELGMLHSCHLQHEMLLASDYQRSSMISGLGPWYVDLLDSLVESPAKRIEMIPSKIRGDGLVVTGRAEIAYQSGARSSWTFSFEGPSVLGLKLTLTGAAGEATADLTTGEYAWRRQGGDWNSGVADCTRPEAGFVGMRESLRAFISAARGQGKTMSGPDVIRRIQPVLLELRRQEAEISGEQARRT